MESRCELDAQADDCLSSDAQVTALSANTPASPLRKQKRDEREMSLACFLASCLANSSATSCEPARCRSAANLPLRVAAERRRAPSPALARGARRALALPSSS